MNKFFTTLKNEAKKHNLSKNEKQLLRTHILSTVYAAPKVAQAVKSPYTSLLPRLAVPTMVLLVAALGGGTVFAAQGTLPGDVLYPMKIQVNERLEGVLAVSDTAKIVFNTKLAQRRLEEAESLAAQGELTATTSRELQKNFDEHALRVDALTQKVANVDPVAAQGVRAQFSSALAAHDDILTQIGEDSASKETGDESNNFAVHVRERKGQRVGEEVGMFGMDASSTATTTTPTATTTAPTATAKSELLKAEQRFSEVKGWLDATTTEQVEAQLMATQNLINTNQAEKAVRKATQLLTFLEASKKFDKKLLHRLLDTQQSRQSGSSNYLTPGGGVGKGLDGDSRE